jgi:hypothetical protein
MKKSIIVFTVIAILILSIPSNAGAYVHFLHLGANANYFVHRDANFRDVYGSGDFSFGSKVAVRLLEGFHITGGLDFMSVKGTIPDTEFDTEASQRNISAGFAYFFELTYEWELRIGADVLYVDYEESVFVEKIQDDALAYRIEGALMWRLIQDVYFEMLAAYTYGTDDISGRSIKIGGFQAGIGLAFRL